MANTDNFKVEFIKEVMDKMGVSLEEAEKMYEEMGAKSDSAPRLPFPLAKLNSDEGVASAGELVWGPLKDDEGYVYSYENIKRFEDLDVVILHRTSLYSHYDIGQRKTIAKTTYGSPFLSPQKRRDLVSGARLVRDEVTRKVTVEGTNIEMTYQQLVLIGIRPKGTDEPLTMLSIYLKKVPLSTFNKLMDKVGSPKLPVIMNFVTGTQRNGNVKYAVFLDESTKPKNYTGELSTSKVMDKEDYFKNITDIMDAINTQKAYIDGINDYLIKASEHVEEDTTTSESTEDSLPQ